MKVWNLSKSHVQIKQKNGQQVWLVEGSSKEKRIPLNPLTHYILQIENV